MSHSSIQFNLYPKVNEAFQYTFQPVPKSVPGALEQCGRGSPGQGLAQVLPGLTHLASLILKYCWGLTQMTQSMPNA